MQGGDDDDDDGLNEPGTSTSASDRFFRSS